jgi:hypothetical protein
MGISFKLTLFTTLKRCSYLVKQKNRAFSDSCQSNIALKLSFSKKNLLVVNRFRKKTKNQKKHQKIVFF